MSRVNSRVRVDRSASKLERQLARISSTTSSTNNILQGGIGGGGVFQPTDVFAGTASSSNNGVILTPPAGSTHVRLVTCYSLGSGPESNFTFEVNGTNTSLLSLAGIAGTNLRTALFVGTGSGEQPSTGTCIPPIFGTRIRPYKTGTSGGVPFFYVVEYGNIA